MRKAALFLVFFVIPLVVFWGSFQFHQRPKLEAELSDICADFYKDKSGLQNVTISFEHSGRDALLMGTVASKADRDRAEALFAQALKDEPEKYAGVRTIDRNEIKIAALVAVAEPKLRPPAPPVEPKIAKSDPQPKGKPKPAAPVAPPLRTGDSELIVKADGESIIVQGLVASDEIRGKLIGIINSHKGDRAVVSDDFTAGKDVVEGAWESEVARTLGLILDGTTEASVVASKAHFEIEGAAETALMHGALMSLFNKLEEAEFTVAHKLSLPENESPTPPVVEKSDNKAAENAPAPVVPDEQFVESLQKAKVYFRSGVSTLVPAEVDRLKVVAAALKEKYPDLKLIVAGYGDAEGDPDINSKMNLKRAGAIKEALVQNGVAAERVELVNKGAGKAEGDRPPRYVDLLIKDPNTTSQGEPTAEP